MRWMFIPGLNCRPEIWEGADRLAGVEPVLTEWPRHGITSMDDAAWWLAGEVARLQVDGIVGHSLGGTTALHLYGHLQHRPLLPLVIVDSFMAPPHPMFRNHVWDGPAELQDRIRRMIDDERPHYAELGDGAQRFEEDAAWIDSAVGTGAAFLYGGRGGDVDDDEVARRAGVPEPALSRVQVLPRTSHFLMLEQPDAFYDMLAPILAQARP